MGIRDEELTPAHGEEGRQTSEKVWFITGASRGFGREWAIAALERGDAVAATARDTAAIDDLVARFGERVLALELEVTDQAADFAAVAQAHGHFGRLDVSWTCTGAESRRRRTSYRSADRQGGSST